jgi:hypothetical protein
MRDLQFVLATLPMLRMNSSPGTIKSKEHPLSRTRKWALAALAVMFSAGHGIIFYCASSYVALSAGFSGVILLIAIKHVGLLGLTYTLLRLRWPRR